MKTKKFIPKKKDVIIIKNKKYYNTITKRYIAESTAKRYSSFFRRNPKGLVMHSWGGYKYDRDIPLDKLSKKTVKLFYSDTQVVKTRDKKGKIVYYSPITKTEVPKDVTLKMEKLKLDYRICDNRVQVKLYRLSRDNRQIYHVFRWSINKHWHSVFGLEDWIANYGVPIMNCILNEVYKVSKKHMIGKFQTMYSHFEQGYYSDIDTRHASFVFGLNEGLMPHRANDIRDFGKLYKSRLKRSVYKLESDAYRNYYIETITVFVWSGAVKGVNDVIAKYRKGVLGITDKRE